MSELVRQQLAPGRRRRSVAATAEHDALPDGVGVRADVGGRRRCSGVVVNSDASEVCSEARLHERTCRSIERTSWGAEYPLDTRRQCAAGRGACRTPLQSQSLASALLALATPTAAG